MVKTQCLHFKVYSSSCSTVMVLYFTFIILFFQRALNLGIGQAAEDTSVESFAVEEKKVTFVCDI